jgi:AcrR family transcriptional regulator
MLLHHFGSRDELLLTIVDEVERRQMSTLPDADTEPADAMAAMWADVRRPELRPFERLFFECYARGAQGEQPYARMLPGAVESWLAEVDAKTDSATDPALVRLGLAVTRGLLLDLVATDDDEGVDAAAAAFVELLRAAQTNAASLPASRST